MSAIDVLIVSPATTAGWRTSEAELAGSLERLGVTYHVERIELGPSRHLRRAWPLVDLVEAWAARRALGRGLAACSPRATILITATAALLAPIARLQRRGIAVAVRLDCPAAVNRPGAANALQRALERRRLPEARLAIAMGPRSAEVVAPLAREAIVLPTSIEVPRAGGAPQSPPRVLVYSANPAKKGLDRICRAWALLGKRRGDAILTVDSIGAEAGRRFLARHGLTEPAGVEWVAHQPREHYLELLAGSAAYVSASRIEDHGIAQLEALAAGVPLVTTPSPGAYEAEPLARRLAPRLVAEDGSPEALADALAVALAMSGEERSGYAASAAELMEPFGRARIDEVMRDRVLPALGISPRA